MTKYDRAARIIIGGSGLAVVLIDLLRRLGAQIKGVSLECEAPAELSFKFEGSERFCGENLMDTFRPGSILLVNGLVTVTVAPRRRQIFERFKNLGFQFAT